MYPVRARSLRAVCIASALMACASMYTAPTQAGDNGGRLKIIHQVGSGSCCTFVTFGPVTGNCNATTFGSDCTFITVGLSGSGRAEPGGPFTETDTETILLGPGNSLLYPNGALDSAGNPSGGCAHVFGSSHQVFANGTIDLSFQRSECCAASVCGGYFTGPPNTAHLTSVCTSGTGKYAGIQCSNQYSGSSSDGVNIIGSSEGVSTK
jgi:hypothetical protein